LGKSGRKGKRFERNVAEWIKQHMVMIGQNGLNMKKAHLILL